MNNGTDALQRSLSRMQGLWLGTLVFLFKSICKENQGFGVRQMLYIDEF